MQTIKPPMTDSTLSQIAERWTQTIPIISLWMPWANWVMLGWKPIETRTHNRFKSLAGKYIGIHATAKWDNDWLKAAGPYLTEEQIIATKRFLRIGGAILGKAFVSQIVTLTAGDSRGALIDCGSVKRTGLILQHVHTIEAIPAKGKQGIWYHELIPSTSPDEKGNL